MVAKNGLHPYGGIASPAEQVKEANVTDLYADGLCTVTEAAKFLGVGTSTLYELMEAGELAWVSLGRRMRRIPRRALIGLAQSTTKGGWKHA